MRTFTNERAPHCMHCQRTEDDGITLAVMPGDVVCNECIARCANEGCQNPGTFSEEGRDGRFCAPCSARPAWRVTFYADDGTATPHMIREKCAEDAVEAFVALVGGKVDRRSLSVEAA